MNALGQRVFNTVMLFSSFSTLFCCALPALFVALGAGATLAGIVTDVPQLVWLSEHKVPLFVFAGCMLTLSGVMQYRAKYDACPMDAGMKDACTSLRKGGRVVWRVSLVIYATGVFFAFVAPYIL